MYEPIEKIEMMKNNVKKKVYKKQRKLRIYMENILQFDRVSNRTQSVIYFDIIKNDLLTFRKNQVYPV